MKEMKDLKESEIQKQILDYLKFLKIFCWRNNTVGIYNKKLNRYVKSGSGTMKGVGDILCCLPDGKLCSIEVKRPNKLPTKEQREFMNEINKRGGLAFVASSLDDVIKHANGYLR